MDNEPPKGKIINKPIKSFETAKGSVYTYDKKGKTLRYKTVDQELQEKMDITVFISTDEDTRAKIFDAYTRPNKFSFHLVEVRDNNPVQIYGLEDIENPENLKFGVLNIPKNKWAFYRKASLTPTMGAVVYERGNSTKDSGKFIHHLGHEVTKINY
ncbi:MAG TPA: hypothetical protein VN174_03385 [Candidatus Methanoperedens sp.]|nr:hypothetical protein [Candidatus Methanoperedens sp.]